VLLSREISIPSRRVLKSTSLHSFAPSGCLTPRLTASNVVLARELVVSRTRSCSAMPRGSLMSDP
jgi:hypothetical protein